MGGMCLCYAWTCRPMWPVFIILAAIPCMMHCSESPAASVGKMYPRGNHWAVGHLMGKKSIETLPELQQANSDSDYLTPPETEPDRYERLMEALSEHNNLKQMKAQIAGKLLQVSSSWREEDRDKYLREMSDLLLLALKLQGNDSP